MTLLVNHSFIATSTFHAIASVNRLATGDAPGVPHRAPGAYREAVGWGVKAQQDPLLNLQGLANAWRIVGRDGLV